MHITTLRLPQLYNEYIMLGFITTPSQFLTRSPADALFVSEVLAFTSLRCTTTQRHTTDGDSLRGTPPGGNALLGRLLGSGWGGCGGRAVGGLAWHRRRFFWRVNISHIHPFPPCTSSHVFVNVLVY
jgi:hypothetical protein